MITVNAMGDACPIPVVKAKKALQQLTGAETVEVLVDNEIAVQNLTKLAKQQECAVRSEKLSEARYRVVMEVGEKAVGENADAIPEACAVIPAAQKKVVVAIASDRMGSGNDELGKVLIKGFIFALTQQEQLPSAILFYNGGATLTTEGSASLEDLKSLEAQGVEILTCGTCLNFYGLTEKLAVGSVTNMYTIVEKMTGADLIVKP